MSAAQKCWWQTPAPSPQSLFSAAREPRRAQVITFPTYLSTLQKALQKSQGPLHPRLAILSPPLPTPTFCMVEVMRSLTEPVDATLRTPCFYMTCPRICPFFYWVSKYVIKYLEAKGWPLWETLRKHFPCLAVAYLREVTALFTLTSSAQHSAWHSRCLISVWIYWGWRDHKQGCQKLSDRLKDWLITLCQMTFIQGQG